MDERFLRHELIADWRQEELARATVIVVGMGALGNEASRVLAMAGIGSLIVCDPDMVETSNLSRTTLFRTQDVGRNKAEAAADALKQMLPGIRVVARPAPHVRGVGLAEIRGASLVLSCLDSHSARLQLAGRCNLVRAAMIDGGTHPWGGDVRPYLNPDGSCYGCGLSEAQRGIVDSPWSCLDVEPEIAPASAPASVLVGGWMASLAIRRLMGLQVPEGLLKIDLVRGTTEVIPQRRDPTCMLHSAIDGVEKLGISSSNTVEDLFTALPAGSRPILWEPIRYRLNCQKCDFADESLGLPDRQTCPNCGSELIALTTLYVTQEMSAMRLVELGVAPREILPVRTGDGMRYFELVG